MRIVPNIPASSTTSTSPGRMWRRPFRWGRLARNPADAADPPRAGQKSDGIRTWDAPTLRTFLERSRESGDRLHPLWVVLTTTAMRRGEAIGLRWKDVDLDNGRLRVVQTITQTRSKVTIGEPKTASGRRSIALDPATVAVLREHRKAMLEERMLVGPDFSDEGSRVPPTRRRLPSSGCCQRPVRPKGQRVRAATPDRARPPPHVGHARPRARHPPEGRARTPRSLGHRDHLGPLQPRRPHPPRPGGGTHRGPRTASVSWVPVGSHGQGDLYTRPRVAQSL